MPGHQRYASGVSSFITVLDAERTLQQNQILKVEGQAAVSADLVMLYKTLGGGWQSRTDRRGRRSGQGLRSRPDEEAAAISKNGRDRFARLQTVFGVTDRGGAVLVDREALKAAARQLQNKLMDHSVWSWPAASLPLR